MIMGKDYFDIKDNVIIITGGSGKLGSIYSKYLLDRGAYIFCFDIIGNQKAKGKFGKDPQNPKLAYLEVDITEKSSISLGLQNIIKDGLTPTGLINNAALDSSPDINNNSKETGPFETYPVESWENVLNVNLTGTFLVSQIIGSYMAENKKGSIININSHYGLISPDQRIYNYTKESGVEFNKPIAYSVSKSGITNLTRYLATYWAEKNIRVNTLTLGGVYSGQDPRFVEEYSKRVPLGRMSKGEEYCGSILFLISDASSYMTGSNLIVDGGWTAW